MTATAAFDCRRCAVRFIPRDDQWIFYSLCDACFAEFNGQRMKGRFSGKRAMFTTAPPEVLGVLGVSSSEEIPEQPQSYFEECADWLASLVAKEV